MPSISCFWGNKIPLVYLYKASSNSCAVRSDNLSCSDFEVSLFSILIFFDKRIGPVSIPFSIIMMHEPLVVSPASIAL